MILFIGSHRTKNNKNVSPFNELFLSKISLNHKILVLSVRNISFHRKVIYKERFSNYEVIELSAFFLPGSFSRLLLRIFNYLVSKVVFIYLKRRQGVKRVKVVHQVGLFTPVGFYLSRFYDCQFLLQLIGNDIYNFNKWKIKYSSSTIITANSKSLSCQVNVKFNPKVIYRGVNISLHTNYVNSSTFKYKKLFYGGGFPDYKERSDIQRYNYKGGISLINVCKQVEGYEFIFAGPNCKAGKAYAEIAGVKNIQFAGYLTHSAVLEQLREADIVIIPSFDEGIANIAMEAMLAERLVISRKVGGMEELIQNYKTGILFDSDEELLKILIDLSKVTDEDKIKHLNQMRINARIHVMQ